MRWWQFTLAALLLFSSVLGLIVACAMLVHVYQDHLWDDTMRQIQKQQIQQLQKQQQQQP